MVRTIGILFLAFALPACQSETEEKIQLLQSELQSAQLNLSSCENANTELLKEKGKVDLAQWDEAVASDLEIVSPEQELEIRRSLGEKMGIEPSQVDWKEIYRSRGKAAKSQLSGKNYGLEFAQERYDELCKDKDQSLDRVQQLEIAIRKLGGVA